MRWSQIHLLKNLPHLLRKRLGGKKIVVFESDDWGMLRTPDQKALDFAGAQAGSDSLTRWTYDS